MTFTDGKNTITISDGGEILECNSEWLEKWAEESIRFFHEAVYYPYMGNINGSFYEYALKKMGFKDV